MARFLFAGTPADIYAYEDEDGDLQPGARFTVLVYDGQDESASRYTDLLDADGLPATSLTVGEGTDGGPAGRLPSFYGPDGVSSVWISVNNSPRQLLKALDLGSYLVDVRDRVEYLLSEEDPNPLGLAITALTDVDGNSVEEAGEGTTLIKQLGGQYAAGLSPIPLSDYLWVAASNAPDSFDAAPYVCDGVDDQVQINQALENPYGLKVGLSPGTFQIADTIWMRGPSNTDMVTITPRYLIGSGQSATKLVVAPSIVGCYIYNNAQAVITDLTFEVANSRAIYAWSPTTPIAAYRSWSDGLLARITVRATATHATYGISIHAAIDLTIEDVTITGTGGGIEFSAMDAVTVSERISVRRCHVQIASNSSAYRVATNGSGTIRNIEFLACSAAVDSALYNTTFGFSFVASPGRIYGARIIGGSTRGFSNPLRVDSSVSRSDFHLAYVEAVTNGQGAWIDGYANKVTLSEVEIASGVTNVRVINDTNTRTAQINTYDTHLYTISAASTVLITNTTGVVKRGLVEGPGTVPAAYSRNPRNLISQSHIATVRTTSGVLTPAANFTVNAQTTAMTSLDGKLIRVSINVLNANAYNPTASTKDIADLTIGTVAATWRPTEAVSGMFTNGLTHGEAQLNTDGTVVLRTLAASISASTNIVVNFIFIKA